MDPDPNWIRIQQLYGSGSTQVKKRIINTGKLDAIEDKSHHSETQLIKKTFPLPLFVTGKQLLSVCGCLDEAGALNVGHKVGQMLRQRLHTQQKVAISLISLLIPVQYCTGKP